MKPVILSLILLVTCCSKRNHTEVKSETALAKRKAPESAITRRVDDSLQRLTQTQAGQVILKSIQYHGGLELWFGGKAVSFEYHYQPVDGKPSKHSIQTVDLLTSHVYQQLTQPVQGKVAFDGNEAWSTFDPKNFPVRFWSLTPYYFVAMPYVFSDPGVNLELTEDDSALAGLGPSFVVRVTFGDEVGDAPDDYYIAYFDKKDYRLLAVRYVVTYKPFFSDKEQKQSQEKILVFEKLGSVESLKISTHHVFYLFSMAGRGQKVTDGFVKNFDHGVLFDQHRMEKPKGAFVDRSLDSLSP